MRRVSLLGIGISLVILAGCGSGSSSTDPSALVLRLSDLPAQTKPDTARAWTNAQAAKRDGVPVSLYDGHGRVRSYSASFLRTVMNGAEPTWLLSVQNEVTEYRDAAGARWGYNRQVDHVRHDFMWNATTLGTHAGQKGIPAPFHPTKVARVGDADAAFVSNWGGDEVAYTTRQLVFRRGRWVSSLKLTGLQDNVAIGRIVTLAQDVDRRISKAQ